MFAGHTVRTVREEGWSGTSNGDLLARASASFDVLVPTDRSMEYQQNMSLYDIALVVLQGRSNDMIDLAPLVPQALTAMTGITSGQIVRIGARE